jgi:hypothetical protein
MKIKTHNVNNTKIAEIDVDGIFINSEQDAIDLLGNLYYQGYDKVILFKENITPEFFDLKTGIAGNILQKFSNYQFRLAIVGDFSEYNSKSLTDFIYECNKIGHLNFLSSVDDAIAVLSK